MIERFDLTHKILDLWAMDPVVIVAIVVSVKGVIASWLDLAVTPKRSP